MRLLFALLFFAVLNACNPKTEYVQLAVGTYTQKEGHVDGKAEGIYILKFDLLSGQLIYQDTIGGFVNPSYINVHPNGQAIYAVNETRIEETESGYISAVLQDVNGIWKTKNHLSSQGAYPCYIQLDNNNEYLLVANYLETVSSIKLNSDGALQSITDTEKHPKTESDHPRQDGPHPHMIRQINDDIVLVSDLGSNKIFHYKYDAGQLTFLSATDMKVHAGPRHFEMSLDHKILYVLNELNQTIECFNAENFDQALIHFQTIKTIDTEAKESNVNCSALKIHPNGKFLYAANRGLQGSKQNSIAVFQIDTQTGQLELIEIMATKGEIPRDFEISPDGQFLLVAHQDSSNIRIFKIDTKSGKLKDLNIEFAIPTPVCLKFFET